MNRLEFVSIVIDELETALANIDADLESVSSEVPVHTWDGVDSTETPVMLVDDREGPHDMPVGHNRRDGVAKDSNGNIIGRRLIEKKEHPVQLVTRIRHQTDSYRMLEAVKEHFRLLTDDPATAFGDDIRDLSLGDEYTRTVEHRSPTNVHQQAIPLTGQYIKITTDERPEPIEQITETIEHTDI